MNSTTVSTAAASLSRGTTWGAGNAHITSHKRAILTEIPSRGAVASFLLLMAERFARKRLHVPAYVEGKDTSGTLPPGERVEAATRGGAGHECAEAATPSCH
ncbi:hypothetical protein ACWDLG_39565 [Nonomuraea sp. NPDC003727]